MTESPTPAAVTAAVPASRQVSKKFVLATLVALNLAVWLDELKFSQLASYWSADLGLDAAATGSVMSSYYLGYAPMLLVAGFLADRFGPRRLLIIAATGITALSLSMVWVTTFTEMYVRNLVFGMFFGLVWAPCNRMIVNWYPPQERTKATSIWLSGTFIATALTPVIALPIAEHFSWQTAFVVVAAFCIPPLVALLRVRNAPEGGATTPSAEVETLPIRELGGVLRDRSIWIMGIGALSAGAFSLALSWAAYGVLTLDGANANVAAVVTPLFMLIPLVFAIYNGRILIGVFRGNTTRYIAFGLLLCAVCFAIASTISMPWVLWAFLIVAPVGIANMIFYGTLATYWSLHVGVRATGTVTGLSTCLQIIASVVLVQLSGSWFNTSVAGHAQLNPVFLVGAAVLVVGAIAVLTAKRIIVTADTPLVAGGH